MNCKHATIDSLMETTKDYIKAHTKNGKYTGETHYLTWYAQAYKTIKQDKENNKTR